MWLLMTYSSRLGYGWSCGRQRKQPDGISYRAVSVKFNFVLRKCQ